MKTRTFYVLLGCFASISALQLLSIKLTLGQESCVVQTYATPDWLVNFRDPNVVPLSPDPTAPDSNDWSEPLGKFNRPYALACDPNGDDFEIELVEWNDAEKPTLFHDRTAGRWSLAATTRPGYNWVIVRARDEYGAEQLYGVYWRGRDEDNLHPRLH